MRDPTKSEPCLPNNFLLHNTLTPREQECLKLFLFGQTASETAKELKISQRTVEQHMDNIKTKCQCRKKRDLIKIFSPIQNS